jgi:hypothetical protein
VAYNRTCAPFLGVIFDQELRFNSHLQLAVKKGPEATLALSSITKTGWGIHYKYARQIYNAVITTRMDYGATVWHRPKYMAITTQIRKLTTIQRIAMKAITGCYRTTPTAALEIETDLPPPWLRLQTKILLAITRMQTAIRQSSDT